MRIIFCSDPWDINRPDSMYELEAMAARGTGLDYSLISFESLVEQQNANKAVRRVEQSANQELGIYRGWMLRPEAYERLYAALADRGIMLINTPPAYKLCHYLPASYEAIEAYTPQSTWLTTTTNVSMDAVIDVLQPFGDKAVIVKDFVKSRKHEWYEACYVPSAADRQVVERVVTRFLELQGEDLNEGLVFREFIEFEPLTTHSKSGMPLTREYRLFFLAGSMIFSTEYWEEGDYSGQQPPFDVFAKVAQNVQSRFFTMDIAKKVDGGWMVVELGDGQVAGLPSRADVRTFYQALAQRAV
ncbi:MAG: ATP-grasp domain-containing protein [Ktedonobacteraceae bacterium]